MLRASLAFFVVAIVAAVFGFSDLAVGASAIARMLFWGFIVLAALALLSGLADGEKTT